LERYKPPRQLNMKRLSVFRDRSHFRGNDYPRAIEKHLAGAAKPVVICSPNARKSVNVAGEITRFIARRGAQHVVLILLAGVPNNEANPHQECEMAYPEALYAALEIPIGADYRGFKGDWHHMSSARFTEAWSKLLSEIYGISREEIGQYAKRRLRQERQLRRAMLCAIIIGLLSWAGWQLWTTTNTYNLAAARQEATPLAERAEDWISAEWLEVLTVADGYEEALAVLKRLPDSRVRADGWLAVAHGTWLLGQGDRVDYCLDQALCISPGENARGSGRAIGDRENRRGGLEVWSPRGSP
jgi:hypothetical protein